MGEKEKSGIGFKIFIYSIEIVIISLILGGAWLLNKVLLAPPLIISFRLVRTKIEDKYDILHLSSIFACMIVSTAICVLGLYLSLPTAASLISNIFIGLIFAVATWHIQNALQLKIDKLRLEKELQELKHSLSTFNADTCTKEELLKRCEELHFSERQTNLAIAFFIDKVKQSELADLYYVEEKSIQQCKQRMKRKLNKM